MRGLWDASFPAAAGFIAHGVLAKVLYQSGFGVVFHSRNIAGSNQDDVRIEQMTRKFLG